MMESEYHGHAMQDYKPVCEGSKAYVGEGNELYLPAKELSGVRIHTNKRALRYNALPMNPELVDTGKEVYAKSEA